MRITGTLLSLRDKYEYKTLIYLNKNNVKAQKYKEEGFKILAQKVDKLPKDIAFRPSFFKKSCCNKTKYGIFVLISKINFKKPIEEKFDSLFHEIGHWLHFQNLPSREESKAIWENVDKEKIKQEVSKRAIERDEGIEFVPEVFKGLIKGKKFDKYIMDIYEKLHGPKVHE